MTTGPVANYPPLFVGCEYQMPIRAYLKGGAFDPAAINAMSIALTEVLETLKIQAEDLYKKQMIATRIIELAHSGMIDPNELRDRLLEERR
jgi:hypothetical protein